MTIDAATADAPQPLTGQATFEARSSAVSADGAEVRGESDVMWELSFSNSQALTLSIDFVFSTTGHTSGPPVSVLALDPNTSEDPQVHDFTTSEPGPIVFDVQPGVQHLIQGFATSFSFADGVSTATTGNMTLALDFTFTPKPPKPDLIPIGLSWNDSRVQQNNEPFLTFTYKIAVEEVDQPFKVAIYWADGQGNKIPNTSAIFSRTVTSKEVKTHELHFNLSKLGPVDGSERPEDAIILLLVVDDDVSENGKVDEGEGESNNELPVPLPCEALLFGAVTILSPQYAYEKELAFEPNYGFSIDEAAAMCNVDHFNYTSEFIALPEELELYVATDIEVLALSNGSDKYGNPLTIYQPLLIRDPDSWPPKRAPSEVELTPQELGAPLELPEYDPAVEMDSAHIVRNNVTGKWKPIDRYQIADGKEFYFDEIETSAAYYLNYVINEEGSETFRFLDVPGFSPVVLEGINYDNGDAYTYFRTKLVGVLPNHDPKQFPALHGLRHLWRHNVVTRRNSTAGAFAGDTPLSGEVSVGTLDLPTGPKSPWHNPADGLDVDNGGDVEPLDVLLIINHLNAFGSDNLLESGTPFPPDANFFDTNDDFEISPIDALIVINAINERVANVGAEGEYGFPEPLTPPRESAQVTADSIHQNSSTQPERRSAVGPDGNDIRPPLSYPSVAHAFVSWCEKDASSPNSLEELLEEISRPFHSTGEN